MEVLNISMFLLFFSVLSIADGGFIGINYGRLGNDLPPPTKVVQLLKSYGIKKAKIFDADQAVLKAFANSGIELTICVPNQLLQSAAQNPSVASQWVSSNVAPYKFSTHIEAIAVGNEVLRDKSMANYLVPAMKNFYKALQSQNFENIQVSTPLAYEVFMTTYPPSSGSFDNQYATKVMQPMLEFLRMAESPLMINVYPFITYKLASKSITLDYALGRNGATVVTDRNNQIKYTSLFDAQVDAAIAALSRLKYEDIPIVISETGWPSKGGQGEASATIANAATYTKNLVQKVLKGGTPLRPKADLTVYLFALFNENQKPGPLSEKNFGLFYPNQTEVYDLSFLKKLNETDWAEVYNYVQNHNQDHEHDHHQEHEFPHPDDHDHIEIIKPKFHHPEPNVGHSDGDGDEQETAINKPGTSHKPKAVRVENNRESNIAHEEPNEDL